MFAVSSLFKGAGLARQLRSGFYDVRNVKDFFRYEQKTNPDRAPMAIWADDRWWTLKDYHAARGSMRQWIERATIQAALMSGGSGDIRPGDTCLVDHRGGDNPIHIVMVESYDTTTKQLVTIEGNSHGIRAERDGKPERVDGDHFKEAKQDGPSASVVNVRNLRDLGPPPGPGTYLVTSPETFVRDDDHLGQIKMDHGKKVSIAANTTVEVTEAKDVGGTRFAKVDRLGWTLFSNLGTETVVEGGYRANRGTTVWGVGRPSIVDFEDGHEYAVHPVPATLQTTSPERMRELAKHKDKEGAAARGVTFAK
jgi:hypothetical protein